MTAKSALKSWLEASVAEADAKRLAEQIAQRPDGRTQDVRDAIRVARLAPQLGVEKTRSNSCWNTEH